MRYSDRVLAIGRDAARTFGDDIEKATDAALRDIRQLPEYEALVDTLVRDAVREIIYEARHTANVAMKKQAGFYGGPAKVVVGTSTRMTRIYESVYNMRVAGTMLGMVMGADLQRLADAEYAIGDGHYVNATLLKSLVGIVPVNKAVREAVTQKRLKTLLRKAQEKVQGEAA